MYPCFKLRYLPLALMSLSSPVLGQMVIGDEVGEEDSATDNAQAATEKSLQLEHVLVTAAEELKQAPGVSIITAEDIRKRPPANDLSDIIRKMPGVNLTGNSSSGQYGNNRQIDIRGMGPENTLILIDGKPVRSRNSVRMGRSGERNTRGDTNWVPAELVERIEVLRGPAAARYGSGAMGGVVNIITKKPTGDTHGTLSYYTNQPESEYEGYSRRYNFSLSGPIAENLGYRLHGNINKTDADDLALNGAYIADSATATTPPAGREGVRNRDLGGLLRWDLTPNQTLEVEGSYSRQGNIYAGDRAVSGDGTALLTTLADGGAETNIMYRQAFSVTHKGHWNWGTSSLIYSYENTRNRRLNEGLAGGGEGSISTDTTMSTSEFDNYSLQGEVNIPFKFWVNQVATLGFEYTKEVLDDPYSVTQTISGTQQIPGVDTNSRERENTNENFALIAESVMNVTDRWTLTPGLRMDHHTMFATSWSPSVNTTYNFTDAFSIKGGIARSIKAPNLYQSNSSYLYYTMGNGCPDQYRSIINPVTGAGGGCYVQGNDALDEEKSWNMELGVAYVKDGWNLGLTYFRNEYEDKIQSGFVPVGETTGGTTTGRILKWENASKAIVAGWEGTMNIPLMGVNGDILSWNTNFTYMLENHNKRTHEVLSVIPEFTINSILDWQATKDLNLNLSMTTYGYQEPRSFSSASGSAVTDEAALKQRGGYTLWSVNGNYDLGKNWSFGAGISNLFDKELKREGTNAGSAGAGSYNEPGRSYYASAKFSF
ncbi:ferric enterobactin receptor [Azomonas agilis]|uniref:Ferric enterobactin receptor n=1 Tax=Azomonas agilis TaxID=116849 RepID=A0A562I089_9GAMM|nr:TonB-dependent siderophore receptor [Azomonas agilis]TWH64457.1 ferric enterobactin receptor [Azomonas agilis]